MSEKKRAITVAIINNMPFVQTAFFESSVALLFETSKKTELSWMNVKTFPVDFARNWAVKRFLETPSYASCDWMGWLDIDMTFPKDMFNIMLDDAEKIVRKFYVVEILSIVTGKQGAAPSTRGPEWTNLWCTGHDASRIAG